MHLIDESAGFMGSTAIVAGTVPVGVGLAYGMKVRGTDQVSCVFHGDAVVEAGVFFESASFAALKQLPVLFVCENNFYSVYSPLRVRQPLGRSIARMVEGLGVPAACGDGNDVAEVFEMTQEALSSIRSGGGPRFLEFSTYRWREHCGPAFDNDLGYRTEAEFLEWLGKDPIARFEKALVGSGIIGAEDMEAMNAMIQRELESAFAYSEDSPFPDTQHASTDIYAAELRPDPAPRKDVGGRLWRQ